MRDGSSVPTKYASELADMKRDTASASAVRNILRSFVSASDNDYRLRCAPERFRTRVFRDLSQDFGDIVAAAAKIDLDDLPATLPRVGLFASGRASILPLRRNAIRRMKGQHRKRTDISHFPDMQRLGLTALHGLW